MAWLYALAKCNQELLLVDEPAIDTFAYIKENSTMVGRDAASTIMLYNKMLEQFYKKQNIFDMISTKKGTAF